MGHQSLRMGQIYNLRLIYQISAHFHVHVYCLERIYTITHFNYNIIHIYMVCGEIFAEMTQK